MKLTVNEKKQMRFAAVTLIIVIAFILIAKPEPESPPTDSSTAINQHCVNQNIQAVLNGTYDPFTKAVCVPHVSE